MTIDLGLHHFRDNRLSHVKKALTFAAITRSKSSSLMAVITLPGVFPALEMGYRAFLPVRPYLSQLRGGFAMHALSPHQANAPSSNDATTTQLSGIRSLGYQGGASPNRVARRSAKSMAETATASSSSPAFPAISSATHATSDGVMLKISLAASFSWFPADGEIARPQ